MNAAKIVVHVVQRRPSDRFVVRHQNCVIVALAFTFSAGDCPGGPVPPTVTPLALPGSAA